MADAKEFANKMKSKKKATAAQDKTADKMLKADIKASAADKKAIAVKANEDAACKFKKKQTEAAQAAII